MSGVNFPKNDAGERPTMPVNQATFENAIKAVSPTLASDVSGTKSWRFGYVKHLVKQVEEALGSPEDAFKIAEAGLDYLHKTMVFEEPEGTEVPLCEAMKKSPKTKYHTAMIVGQGKKGANTQDALSFPYPAKDSPVKKGAELREVIENWVRKGVIEIDTGNAILTVLSRQEDWCDLSDLTFVLFGAGSAMGPFPLLMALGANIVALDLDRPAIWERLIKIAQDSPGTMIFPSKEAGVDPADYASKAGCDMLKEPVAIAHWLLTVNPKERLICGAYAYLDGPLFVRVSVAMDAIIKYLSENRRTKIGIAYLCTPTDVHVQNSTATTQMKKNLGASPLWQKLLAGFGVFCPKRKLSGNARKPVVAKDGKEFHYVDAVIPEQGPNYILAKRLQHWRAVVARRDGCLVSSNIAPATATASVTSNWLFALAYKGMHWFKPLEVAIPEISNVVMSCLLINDIRNPASAANPETKLDNPMELFGKTQFHGGVNRCGYKYSSIGMYAACCFLFKQYVIQTYLVLYNIFQLCGWSYLFWVNWMSSAFVDNGKNVFVECGPTLTFFQGLASIEILHSALGIVPAAPAITAFQFWTRWNITTILNHNDVAAAGTPVFVQGVIFAWSWAEMIRYTFYLCNLVLGYCPYPVKWVRYTAFVVLYPLGAAMECGNWVMSMPVILSYTGRNMMMQFAIKLTELGGPAIMVGHAAGLAPLYLHMFLQRGKALGGKKKPAVDMGKKGQ